MTGMGMEYGALGRGHEEWARLAELMRTTQTELADAPVAGLAPSVQGAAASFLTAWSGYAGESAAICDGMGEGLRLLVHDVTATEEQRQAAFSRLGARLGPQR